MLLCFSAISLRVILKNAKQRVFSNWNSARSGLGSSFRIRSIQSSEKLAQANSVGFRRNFSCTTKLNYPVIPALVVKAVGIPVAILIGRLVRRKWIKLSDNSRARFRSLLWLPLIGSGLAVAGAIYAKEGIQPTPVTLRPRLVLFALDQFSPLIHFERELLREAFKGKVLPKTHPYTKSVNRVVKRLLKENSEWETVGNKQWTITVIDSSKQNAFVMPTGDIFVFTGIFDVATTEDYLAVVLGHEMAHTLLEHVPELHSVRSCAELGALGITAVLWTTISSTVLALLATIAAYNFINLVIHLPHHRLLEAEADQVGLLMSAKACYDVRENAAFWTRMGQIDGNLAASPLTMSLLEKLSTHPNHFNRADALIVSTPQAVELREKCGCPATKD